MIAAQYNALVQQYGEDCIFNSIGTFAQAKDYPISDVTDMMELDHDWQADC